MAKTIKRKSSLNKIFTDIESSHKSDIKDFTSGHLNESHLYKQRFKLDTKTWETSKLSPIKQGLLMTNNQESLSQLNKMKDSIINYSNASYCNTKKMNLSQSCSAENVNHPKPGISKKAVLNLSTDDESVQHEKHSNNILKPIDELFDLKQKILVEELNPLLIEVPAARHFQRGFVKQTISPGMTNFLLPIAEASRRDQYNMMQKFKADIVREQDTTETNLMSGMQTVEHLEFKLRKNIEQLNQNSYGPNFHRLQIYSSVFEDLICESSIFGNVLAQIKNHYDNYVSFLLDQPPAQTKLLKGQLADLTEPEAGLESHLTAEQNRLSNLESRAVEQLKLHEQLRLEIAKQQKVLDDILAKQADALTLGHLPAKRKQVSVKEENIQTISDECEDLKIRIWERLDELRDLRSQVHDTCVPAAVCAHLEQCNRESENEVINLNKKVDHYSKSNIDLENTVKEIFDSYEINELDERKLWMLINSPSTNLDDFTSNEDEVKWNWYIS